MIRLILLLCCLEFYFETAHCDMEKPGKCSASSTSFSKCQNECNNDWECNGLQKCCPVVFSNVQCGRVCQAPCNNNCDTTACATGTTCVVENDCAKCVPCTNCPVRPKPGRCLAWNGKGPCLKNCENDSNCSGNQKCCPLGTCGQLCQDPCKESCNDLPPCLSGKECKVFNGCAQCI